MNCSRVHALAVFFCVALTTAAWPATTTREEKRGDDRFLILENAQAKVVVFPAAGAAITEYVDKRTGTNLVVGTAKKGSAGYAWKEVTRVHPNDPSTAWFGARPYQAKLQSGAGFKGIIATCEAGGLRAEREMRLDDATAELTILLRYTNISDQPKGLWLRWHPYMTLDDPFAESSFFALPGPGPDQMRKFPVGVGWDSNQMDVPGYWLAMNQKSGFGLWMTFRKEQVVDCATWTDYNFEQKHPKRGWFTAELFPKPKLLQAGETTELHCSYFPFRADDDVAKIPMGFVASSDVAAAKRFLSLVRSNVSVVNGHSMVPEPNDPVTALKDNCFFFQHKRRDRFALLDWGIADAMMAVAAAQTNAVRIRLYARAFESQKHPVKLRYELTIIDSLGKTVAQQKWNHSLNPAEARELDKREDFPVQQLPDGWYTFKLEAFSDEARAPIHRYVERRKLIGQRREPMAEARRATDAKPLGERERRFVTALRKVEIPRGDAVRVPIGVEEAGGVARKSWPVRVGVPFAQGRLKKETAIRLTEPDGKEVPTQTKVMGTWPDGSVKWLLVEFPADVPANGHVFYTLDAKSVVPPSGGMLPTLGNERRVKSALRTDLILGLFAADDLWWETGDGRRYRFRLSGEGAGVVLEEDGPLRAVVKATGWYFDSEDAAAKPIAMGELRAEFQRGQSFFRLYHTVTYAGDPWRDTLGSYGIRFRFSDKTAKGVAIELDGKAFERKDQLSLWQADDAVAVMKSGNEIVANGRRASGTAAIGTTVVYHRDLWRLHPKKIEADAAMGSLTFHYWPKEAGAMDWRPREDGWQPSSATINGLAVGVSRTHEFIIEENSTRKLTEYAPLFDEPVVAVVPPRYLCATEALLHLQPYDPERVPELEQLISETFDSYRLNQELYGWYGEWEYGSVPNTYVEKEQRWADFGRYGHVLNEQDICHVPWLAFLRSGDRKYLTFAEANTRHLMEVGGIRLDLVWPRLAGMSRRHHECPWLGPGDYGHSMLDPFLEFYHVTGYHPAWEASERMACAMAEARSGSWRYISNPIAALSRMFLETQQPFYQEQADHIWREVCAPDRNEWYGGDHGNRMVLYYSQMNDECKRLWHDWTDTKDGRFQGLDVLAARYRQTGDAKYAKATAKLFREYQQVTQSYDAERKDPVRWSIAFPTQHVIAHLREMMYASQALAAAKPDEIKRDK